MFNKLKAKLGDGLKQNEILAKHTSFKIGGQAKYFFVAKNSRDLLKAVQVAEDLKVSYALLGRGTNLLVSDAGFDGLIIKNFSDKYEIKGEEIFVESGFSLNRLVGISALAGLSGLEPFAGIPGTVGGAARGNAGAFGVDFGQIVQSVEVYKAGHILTLQKSEMEYGYRTSIFKKEPSIILSAVIKLKNGDPKIIAEKNLENIKTRQKFPTEPSAGCFFKNCELSRCVIDEKRILKELEITKEEWQKTTQYGKVPIGYLIDKLGLKGKTIGGAKISETHGAFIVNFNNAKAEHVMMLVSDIKMRVRNQLGIQLEEEVQYLGF